MRSAKFFVFETKHGRHPPALHSFLAGSRRQAEEEFFIHQSNEGPEGADYQWRFHGGVDLADAIRPEQLDPITSAAALRYAAEEYQMTTVERRTLRSVARKIENSFINAD